MSQRITPERRAAARAAALTLWFKMRVSVNIHCMSQRTTPERRAAARAAAAAAARAECTFRPATNEAASRQLLARIVAGRETRAPLGGPGFGSPTPSHVPAEAEAARAQDPWQPEAGCGAGRLAANPSPGRGATGDGWEQGSAASYPGASRSGSAERVEIGEVSGEPACSPGEPRQAQSCTDSTRISTAHSSIS